MNERLRIAIYIRVSTEDQAKEGYPYSFACAKLNVRYFKKAFLEEKRIRGLTRKQKERLIYGKNKNYDRARQCCPEF